ncbi:male sterility protein-domain-containing protein [Xylaria sp. FL1042]|nr:male sterility protein-domain-containing protein [Xylaria sp. FL1042]
MSGTSSDLPKPIIQTEWNAIGCLPTFTDPIPKATFTATSLYHGGLADAFRAWTSGAMIWFFHEAINVARWRSDETCIKYFSSVPCVLQMLAEMEGGAGLEILLLSPINDPNSMVFEPREDGLSELVVKCGWPLRLKTNREDGSYATADLFKSHPLIPNAWRYHGRAEALTILANGKKFDPLLIEDELRALYRMIRGVLVFGTGTNYPGVLLFTHSRGLSDDEYLKRHSRLSRLSIAIIRVKEGEEPLPKSSKRTTLRRQAESRYANTINQVYTTPILATKKPVLDDELVHYISEVFNEVLGRPVNPAEDIYSQGVNSITCIRITKQIQATLFRSKEEPLPPNLIYNNGTIHTLANTKDVSEAKSSKKQGIVVLLTGATSGLGAHVLNELIDDFRVTKVYCLLRGQSCFGAEERVLKALIKQKPRTEKELKYLESLYNKILYVFCDFGASNLSLSDEERSSITAEATHIIHSAWTVNFNLGLKSFESQLANTRDLIELAYDSGAEFFFISSTAAVCNTVSNIVPEKVSSEPRDAPPLGYSRSKWIAEQICASAYTRIARIDSTDPVGKPRISIIRVGQLCGNKFGVWNASEAYPLLLSTAKLTSRLPGLPSESLNWLPVDVAARGVIEIALPQGIKNASIESECSNIPVYHVLNSHRPPSWNRMLEWLSKEPGSTPFEVISVTAWMKCLREQMWKQQYILKRDLSSAGFSTEPQTFEVASTRHASQSIHNIIPLDRQKVIRMWEWIQENY